MAAGAGAGDALAGFAPGNGRVVVEVTLGVAGPLLACALRVLLGMVPGLRPAAMAAATSPRVMIPLGPVPTI